MSKLRPETRTADPSMFSPKGATAYLMTLNAVMAQDGLIAGKLDGPHGEHCTIGSYFAINPQCAMSMSTIDEVAAVNDSFRGTPKQRKAFMVRWLKWKLTQAGMPGFATKHAPRTA